MQLAETYGELVVTWEVVSAKKLLGKKLIFKTKAKAEFRDYPVSNFLF